MSVKHTNLGNYSALGTDHDGNPGFERLGRILVSCSFHFKAALSLSVASKGRSISNRKKLSSIVFTVLSLMFCFSLEVTLDVDASMFEFYIL